MKPQTMMMYAMAQGMAALFQPTRANIRPIPINKSGLFGSSAPKYIPGGGPREVARRKRQIDRGILDVTGAT